MKTGTKPFLDKAARAIVAAETLLANNFADFAAGRAYYAMFYVAEALLNELNLSFSKHGGVHSAFGEHYIKTGLFDSKYHRWLLDAFDQRIEGDYAAETLLMDRDAQELINHAKIFLLEAERFLGDHESE